MAAWVACSPALSSPHRAGSSGRAAQSVVSVAARTGRVSMTSFNGARPACDSRGGCTMVAPAVALSTAEPMPNGATARRRRWHHRVHRHQLTSIPPLPPYPSRSVQLPWPADIVRATSDRPCRLDVPTCEDLLGALRACTACVRMLHAFLTGPGRVPGDGVRPRTHLVGTGVRCRRQPWRVHAHGRLSAIARCPKSSCCTPYYSKTSSLRNHPLETQCGKTRKFLSQHKKPAGCLYFRWATSDYRNGVSGANCTQL